MHTRSSLTIIGFAAFLLPFIASAHHSQVLRIKGDQYKITVGSLNEPITVGDKTGVDLTVMKVSTTGALTPMMGLEAVLKTEVSAGSQKKVFDLSAQYQKPGKYQAIFYPTSDKGYSYRIFGTLAETPIDITFRCSSAGHVMHGEANTTEVEVSPGVTRVSETGSFGCPAKLEDMQFPPISSDRTFAVTALALSVIALAVSAKRRKSA